MRAGRLLAAAGLAELGLLAPVPRRHTRRGVSAQSHAVEVAAALVAGRPGMTLAQFGAELVRLRHLPPGDGPAWAPSSLKAVLDRARAQGLLAPRGGGFKWLSQHLDGGGCDGQTKAALGSGGARRVALAGAAGSGAA